MTKFEEKLEKLPIKTIKHPVGDTKYYAAVHVKTLIAQADEEFQALKEEYSNQADSILLMLEEIGSLKSQLQQQALPVVPECVGELFNEYRFENIQRLFEFGIDDIKSNKMIKALKWRDEHPDIFALAFITGKYQVEKPQLFYLKHIDMSKADKEFDHYLFRIEVDRLAHHIVNKNNLPHNYRSVTFTQQEIDSMETGSYEQIEVVE